MDGQFGWINSFQHRVEQPTPLTPLHRASYKATNVRNSVAAFGWIAQSLFLGLIIISTAAGANRPNVVLIVTDDQNDYALHGNGVTVHTPNLDRFAEDSIRFSRAYCASPICIPSRTALFSGLYPHHTGAYLHRSNPWFDSEPLKAAVPLPELFRRSGYFTWGMGKLLHAALPPERADKQWSNRPSENGNFNPFPPEQYRFTDKYFSVKEWDGPPSDFPDIKGSNDAIRFIQNYPFDEPFFMVYGLWRPHTPFTAPREFFDLYDPKEIQIPPPGYSKEDLDDLPLIGRNLAKEHGPRWEAAGKANPEAWRRVMHGYLACTSFADWNIGRVIEALDASRHADNTIVIVTSDNGFHIGEKDHFGKCTLWEMGTNVPMTIRLPGKKHAGTTCESAVSHIDLYPTLVAQCGLESPPQELDGRDISPLFEDPTTEWDFPAVTTHGFHRFSVRSGPWRYIRYQNGTEELYDHRVDNHEFTNLGNSTETEAQRAKFRELVPSEWEPQLRIQEYPE